MRTRRKLVGIVVGAAVALALGGCVQPPSPVIPTSTPSAAPVFASDAAALAAAKKAYVAYLAVSDAVANDGGMNPERLSPVVTKAWLSTEVASYVTFAKSGDRFTGQSGYTTFSLQKSETVGDDLADVTAYICADVSNTRLIDATGADITPSTRESKYPIVAEFKSAVSKSSKLLFAGSEPWSGKNFCS
jgi:hypothetical protein